MKQTDLIALAFKIGTEDIDTFVDNYNQLFLDNNPKNMPIPVKPAQVILDNITECCTLYLLRNPKNPAYLMNDYVFQMSGILKKEYQLSTVIIKPKKIMIDENDVPEFIKVNPADDAAEIIKRAQEDELFTVKKAEYESKQSKKKAVLDIDSDELEPDDIDEDIIDEEDIEKPEIIKKIKFSIEKNGQLCLVL